MPDKLLSIRSKIEWAKKRVHDLDVAIRTFLESHPYKCATKHDPDTRELTYYVSHVESVPWQIPQITGDAIGNMVSILDHLAYRLFLKSGGGGDGHHVYFPIGGKAANRKEYISSRQGKVKGISAKIVDAIDKLEPYQGGKGHQLWVLSQLNNLSKHRDLIAVGSRLRRIDQHVSGPPKLIIKMDGPVLPPVIPATALMEIPANTIGLPIIHFILGLDPRDKLCPLKVGDKLGTGAVDAEPDNYLQFAFDVAFNEPEIIQAEPLIETVHQLSDLVSKIVDQFASYL